MAPNAIETMYDQECSEHATTTITTATTTTTATQSDTTIECLKEKTIEMPSMIKATETTIMATGGTSVTADSYNFIAPAAPLSTSPSPSASTSTSTTPPTSSVSGGGGGAASCLIKKTPSDFIFGKCIGEGSFSSVYLALGRHDRREYAIKVCEKRKILRERKQIYVRRERELLQVMSHTPGFVNLICTFQDNRSLYFVMTYAPNGELLPHIKRVGCFSVECARHYAAELVLACEQMHRRNVVHRDLKPENILLDAKMHTLIADFGSAKLLTAEDIAAAESIYINTENLTTPSPTSSSTSLTRSDESDDVFDEASDDADEASAAASKCPQRYRHKRKGSFVGTAQYVSPEVLQNMPITTAADLWALGCILYQMISGMPPFRGYNDFAIFKEILASNFEFPENFDKEAKELVVALLKMKPIERLGATDAVNITGYSSIRMHPFFDGIDFDKVRQQTPPKIRPFLPAFCMVDEDTENLVDETRNLSDLSAVCDEINYALNSTEKAHLLEQQKTDKWHHFTENEVILKKGLVNKHKGLFSSKRMLLLTTGPHLIYIDPFEMIKMGEVTWDADLRIELGNRRIFYLHITNRTHFFEVLEGSAIEWVAAIEKMHSLHFNSASSSSSSFKGNELDVTEVLFKSGF